MENGYWELVFGAATIATAVSTAATVVLSVWWRSIDRRRAIWVPVDMHSFWDADGAGRGKAGISGRFSNVSTGSAFALHIAGVGCCARIRSENGHASTSLVPLVDSGANVSVLIHCEPNGWDDARVVLAWYEPSLWRRRLVVKVRGFRVMDISPRPRLRIDGGFLPDEAVFIDRSVEPVMLGLESDIDLAVVQGLAGRKWRMRVLQRLGLPRWR